MEWGHDTPGDPDCLQAGDLIEAYVRQLTARIRDLSRYGYSAQAIASALEREETDADDAEIGVTCRNESDADDVVRIIPSAPIRSVRQDGAQLFIYVLRAPVLTPDLTT